MSGSASVRAPWTEIDALPRQAVAELDRDGVPARPGVFVVYRDDHPVYIGKSANLHVTIAQALSSQPTATVPPLRRAVAGFLGIAHAQAIAAGRFRPTPEDQQRITRWLHAASLVWQACASESAAVDLERRLQVERVSRPSP